MLSCEKNLHVAILGPVELGELHRGRRFVVSRARLVDAGPPVVVKAVLGEASDETLSLRLRREYDLLASLDVPGVVRPIGFEPVAGRLALILEDAGAQNLKQWLRGREPSVGSFLEIAVQLSQALVWLHGRNIIHRDINPRNVVVDQQGRATLIDFEAATDLSASEGASPRLDGDLSYVAPEETGRMNRRVDQRADLYSLGVVFYEMLTGLPPFVSADPVQLVHAHLARAPVPPCQVNPAIPDVLSDIVLRLLAKMPEARYQSAESLRQDLGEAKKQLARAGRIAPFDLGLVDLANELPLPARLYQRESQRAALVEVWEAALSSGVGAAVVAGAAGSGKTALVTELAERALARKGRFVSAKFDAEGGQAPYAPFAEAFRGVIASMLSGPSTEIAAWRQRMERALGDKARAVVDLVPELERLLGAPPPMPSVGPAETQSRLHIAFEAFVRVLASEEHPLLLLVDDLQWADSASLALLERLATTSELRGLFIAVTLRPEERKEGSLVTKTLASLSTTRSFRRIDVMPLTFDAVVELCRDTLSADAERVLPLAALLFDKTAGNPFFLRRMLRFLHQSALLVFDPVAQIWTWDLAAIRTVDVAENVVDLLLVVLRGLPAAVQALLERAACIGSRVPLPLLAAVAGLPRAEATGLLAITVRAGLLVPVEPEPNAEKGSAFVDGGWFRFCHDRIRQAAYLLSGEEARRAIHIAVGRRLLADAKDEQALEDQIYAIVDQLNRGIDLITRREERLDLARLNLRAARKARGSSAYAPALAYIECAMATQPPDAWESHHDETMALHRTAIEFAGFAGETTLAAQLFERTLGRARTLVEKADLYKVRMYAAICQSEREDAFALGCEGARLFGIELPTDDVGAAIGREMRAVTENLAGRAPSELLDAPLVTQPEQLACMSLVSTLLDATYFHRPDLFPFVASRAVNMSLEHGHAVSSAQAYASYAVLVGMVTRDYATAYEFGRLSMDLAARFGEPMAELRVLAIFTTCLSNWTAPIAPTLPLCQTGQARAFTLGDTYFASAFSMTEIILRLHQGADLGSMVRLIQAGIGLLRTARYRRGLEDHLVFLQVVRSLQGASASDEDRKLAGITLDDRGLPSGLTEQSGKLPEYEIAHLAVACHLRDFSRVLALSAAAAPQLQNVPRFVQVVEHNFYTSIAMAALASRAAPEERATFVASIARNQQQLALWAKNGSENYGHKHLVVMAELARLAGDNTRAADLYDQAISAAGREGFVQDEALANELCGRFYLAQDRRRIAGLYLSASLRGYAHWGAKAKVDALEAELVALKLTEDPVRAPVEREVAHDDTGGAALDLLALFRGAEAVSSEVMLPRLLAKLMEVCLAAGGAQRGAFVLDEDGRLFVRAVGEIDEAAVLERTLVDESAALSRQAVHQVARTREALVVGDAATHEQLSSDPYVVAHSVRSLLALPILRQGRLMGVLYLENNLATRVFTPERVRLLMTLSSQIATSLQNSLLFEQLRQEIEERRRAEATVRFLGDAGAELAESLESHAMLKKLTELTGPVLADWCAVHAVEDDKVAWVAATHVDATKQAILERQVQGDVGTLPRHVAEVQGSNAPVLHATIDRAVVERYLTQPDAVQVVQAIGAESAMILPLRAHGRFLGALTLASHAPDRRFGAADLVVAAELARRAATAIDNARLYREVKEAVRVRDEFLSIASHELNTPIASLKLVSQSFEGSDTVPPPVLFARIMNIIKRQTSRLSSLVGDLLDVTQISAGSFQLRSGSMDLGMLVRETAELFTNDLDKANCELVLNTEVDLVGHWDRVRLQQVVANLLSNAIKFAPGKRIEITVARAGTDRAQLVVADRGMGIDQARLPHIFGRFERAVPSSHYGGLGLGLYIVQAVVHALGGTVTAASRPGEGATFTVELPLGTKARSER